MKNLELKVILNAVDKLTSPLRGVQKQLDKLQGKVKGATDELNKLKQQEKTANAFKRLSDELQQSNHKLVKAKAAAKQLEQQLKNTVNPTAKLKKHVADAYKQAHKMAQAQEQQRKKLNQLRQSLRQGGFDTAKFKTSQQKLKEKIEQSTAAINKQNAAMKRLQQRQAQKQRYNNRIQSLKAGSEQFANLGQRSMVHGAAILGAGYAAGRGVIGMAKTAAQFEQFQTVLETTEGSKEKAKQSMDWISDFATKTPYELNEVTESFVRLRAYGMDPTNGLLKTLGDTSSAMGKPIMQAVEAIADAITGENERLKEFGIKGNAIKGTNFIEYEYTDRNGKQQTARVDKQNRKQIEETLKKIWNEKYADAMEKQSKTLIGIWSNLQDQWVRFQNMIMQSGAFDALKGKLNNVLDTIDKMAANGELEKWANDIGQAISTVVEGIWEAIVIIAKIAKQLGQWIVQNKDLAVSIIKWGIALGGVLTGMGALSALFSYLLYPIARIGVGFVHLTKKSFDFVGSLKVVDSGLLKTTKNLSSVKGWKNVGKGIGSMFKNISTGIETHIITLVSNFKLLGGKVKNLSFWISSLKNLFRLAFSPLRLLFTPIISAISFLLSPIGLLVAALVGAGIVIYRNWDKVRAFFGGFWESLKSGLAPVLEKFKPLGDLFGVVVGWIEKAVKWFTDLLSPVQSTSEDLESARSAGEKFGNATAKAIELILTPLNLLMDGIRWLSENMPSWDGIKNSVSNAWNSTKEGVSSAWQKAKSWAGLGEDVPAVNKWSGGYAGNGGKYQPKGIFHGGEYIMTKEATSRLGVPLLNALNYGKNAMLAAGLGVSVASAQPIKVDNRPPLSAKPQTSQMASQPMQVTININAQQGQSAVDIAKEVEKALMTLENQKQARARSALRDRE
ncbi:tape measure protein [Avibacterium paragallinarum]|uniref:Phage tail protein n=1 Tax=Avibacterium paragallinarum TaxID=728 RepID=A0AAE5TK49_AVIPA|nr:tape measure protein [Avibacterium paragallinarum]MEE3609040.1 tape measure protein [Avibacterium paragallinarum]MEE3621285.1 tape measure protein [Avibacterium paragallinarum]MEE3668557.1 tape measure protein [Avibacterium paragallinarum]MEE3681246.1 tape measure protein [Avibacterium paragallinarum]MEE4386216.1 tape measure protein [Avibacterium paragallinarum]